MIGGYTYRHKDWWEGFKKYAVEMGSGVMIYIPKFHKDWSKHSAVHRGDMHKGTHTHRQQSVVISLHICF
jgi:hypothetical protein